MTYDPPQIPPLIIMLVWTLVGNLLSDWEMINQKVSEIHDCHPETAAVFASTEMGMFSFKGPFCWLVLAH